MLLAVISDLHGNLQATDAVINEIESIKPDRVVCLGDFVGYGPQPAEVINLIREKDYDCLLGNHDAAVAGLLSMKIFLEPNNSLLLKSRTLIGEDNLEWLKGLPLVIEDDNWIAAHASPVMPEKWAYLDNSIKCKDVLNRIPHTFCFVGHTHRPGVVANQFGVFGVKEGYRYLINPGSVGQPRDLDKRASFCTINLKTFEYKNHRVSFDVEEALEQYHKIGFSIEAGRKMLRAHHY